MRAQELTTPPVVTLSPETSVTDAAGVLVRNEVSAAPVVDADGRLVGILSEADVLRGRLAPDPRGHLGAAAQETAPLPHLVAELMTQPVLSLPDSCDVADAVRLMQVHHVRAVPLVSAGRLVGVVTRRDVLRLLMQDDAALHAAVRAALADDVADGGRWSIDVAEGAVHLRGDGGGDPALAAARVRTVAGVSRVDVRTAAEPHATDHAGLGVLTFAECIQRLETTRVGRLAFLDGGEVQILPVNHAMDGSAVVFRTAEGSKLSAAESAAVVAFEVDGYETVRRFGWSVLVKGRAARIYEDETIERLERSGVDAWADAVERPMWVRITPTEVTGRQIAR